MLTPEQLKQIEEDAVYAKVNDKGITPLRSAASEAAKLDRQRNKRHGLYSPNPQKYITALGARETNKFRLALEDAVIARYGRIGPAAAASIHTATEAQRIAIANRAIRAKIDENANPKLLMTADDMYLRALRERDRAIAQLEIDDKPAKDSKASELSNCLEGFVDD